MPPPTAPGGRFVTPPTTSTSDSPVRPATNEVDVDGPLSQPTEPTREADDLPASDGDPISEPNNPTPHRRRIPALVAGVVLIIGGVVAIRAYTERVQAQRNAEAKLATARDTMAEMQRQTAELQAADAELRQTTEDARTTSKLAEADSAEARAALGALEEQRQALQQQMVAADSGRGLQALYNGRMKTCIDGLNRAVNQISVGDASGGASTLGTVQDDCAAAEAAGPSAMPYDFPDPFVLIDGATSYAYATNAGGGNVQLATSIDQKTWRFVGNALPKLPNWVEPSATWAPAVVKLNGNYVLYYSARKKGQNMQCVSVAVAKTPKGPFVDSSTGPLVCQEDQGGSIDPSPFVDLDGTPYLLYKSEGTPVGRSGALWSQQLNPQGTGFAGFPTLLLTGDPGGWDHGVIEGPSMYRDQEGRLWMFYSGAGWSSDQYAVGIAGCPNGPAQPCARANAKPILKTNDRVVGPGGLEAFREADGTPKVVFHAYQPGKVGYPNNRVLVIGTLKLDHDSVSLDY
jgi:uncharacterized membrane-anchored protein YhcB (DUF1043 family)/predicted GH43/DUF377 family glycosyl hydrolase